MGTSIEDDGTPVPVKITCKGKPKSVSAGFNHSALLTEEGSVHVWGKGMSETLKYKNGEGSIVTYLDQFTPRKLNIPNSRKAIEIMCG